MMIRALAAALLLTLAAGAAKAQPPSVIDRCASGPDGDSNLAVADCIYGQVAVDDARLNRNYHAAMARLQPKPRQTLRAAQRAWLKTRDDCPFSRENDGAEFVILVANCVYERTRDRADALERIR